MLRCRFLIVVCSLPALVGASCREAKPWSEANWRPASPPQRIVAASVFASEVLLAIAPRERIAAVHTLAADPEFSLVADQTAGLKLVGAEAEQLLAVNPDLVIIDAFTREETKALLDSAGVPIVRMAAAASFDDVAANIRHLGRVVHLEPAAAKLVDVMFTRLHQLETRGGEVAAWRLCSLDGALHSHGRGSLFDAVVHAAGAHNLAAENGVESFRRLDVEEVMGWRPDALVLAASPGGAEKERQWLHQHPGLRLLTCVQRDRLLFMPAALLGTTSQHLVDTVAYLQQALLAWGHP